MIAQMRARQAQREKERQQMGLDAVLRGFSRGRGGASAAYEEAANRAYAEDTQHQQQMYNLINAINTGNRKEAEKAFDKAIGLGESREKEVGAMSRSQLQALSQMYSSELQAGSSKYNTDAHVRVALAQAERAGRSNDLQERKLAVDGLQSAERGVQSELNKLQGKLDPESRRDRAKLEDNLKALRTRISALSGADKLAPVAAPPGTDPTAPTQGRARFLGYEK
jgi:small-conductance mechanosensitive channel